MMLFSPTLLLRLFAMLLLLSNNHGISAQSTELPIERLTAESFKAMLEDNDNHKWFDAVIDVREESAWQRGHIENATLVESLASFGTNDQVSTPDDLAGCEYCNLVIYCNSGSRAGRALQLLRDHGFYGRLYNGLGIVQWTEAGYSLVTHGISVVPPCTVDAHIREPQCYQAYLNNNNNRNNNVSPTRAPTTFAPQPQPTSTPTSSMPTATTTNNRVAPMQSELWDVAYFDAYKIATNKHVDERYLLYPRGTEPPDDIVEAYRYNNDDMVWLQTPVTSLAIDSATIFPFFDMLSLSDRIVAYSSDPKFIRSPCLLESIQQEKVAVLQTRNDYLLYTDSLDNSDDVEKFENAVAFTSLFNADPPFNVSVKLSASAEPTNNAASFEWIKFLSVFFNAEEIANRIFEAAEERWDCTTETAARTTPSTATVLWAYYNGFCGWNVATCPSYNTNNNNKYYCELAQACSANIVSGIEDETTTTVLCGGGATYLSTDELVELGKNADYWIFPSENWDATYAEFKDQLDGMKSVQTKQVYDYQGYGDAEVWLEHRFTEYYNILQDFCSIVGNTSSIPVSANSDSGWFRNVMDGRIGSLGTCNDDSNNNKWTSMLLDESVTNCNGLERNNSNPIRQQSTPTGVEQSIDLAITLQQSSSATAAFVGASATAVLGVLLLSSFVLLQMGELP